MSIIQKRLAKYKINTIENQENALNFTLLTNAIEQTGPWKQQKITVNKEWYLEQMTKKINAIDWNAAKADVEPFLSQRERMQLKLWNKNFFTHKLKKLQDLLN